MVSLTVASKPSTRSRSMVLSPVHPISSGKYHAYTIWHVRVTASSHAKDNLLKSVHRIRYTLRIQFIEIRTGMQDSCTLDVHIIKNSR